MSSLDGGEATSCWPHLHHIRDSALPSQRGGPSITYSRVTALKWWIHWGKWTEGHIGDWKRRTFITWTCVQALDIKKLRPLCCYFLKCCQVSLNRTERERVCVYLSFFGSAALSAGFIVPRTADEDGTVNHTNVPTQAIQWFAEIPSASVVGLLLYEHLCVTVLNLFVLCWAITVRRWHSPPNQLSQQQKTSTQHLQSSNLNLFPLSGPSWSKIPPPKNLNLPPNRCP